VLVDTDVLIDAGRGVAVAVAFLEQLEQQAELATSVVSQMELIVGCRSSAELRALEGFLRRFQIIGLDHKASDIAVDLLRRFRLSHGLLIADALIAATVLSLGARFVTGNQRDYRFIPGLLLLPYPTPRATVP
jgi:predicted nucleic acid-binding protein